MEDQLTRDGESARCRQLHLLFRAELRKCLGRSKTEHLSGREQRDDETIDHHVHPMKERDLSVSFSSGDVVWKWSTY